MALNIRKFLMLSGATLAMGTLIAAGCGDSETETTTGTGSGGTTSTGGNTSTGGTGGSAACTPTNACERCAATVCETEALACCEATGCQDLVWCVGQNCADAPDQTTCASQECPDELNAGLGSITQAQALGDCITPALENPTNADCEACAAEFGTGGAGGN